jgi:hypothetical protein
MILESNRKCTKFRKTYIKQTLMSTWKAYRLKLLSNKRRFIEVISFKEVTRVPFRAVFNVNDIFSRNLYTVLILYL